MLATVPTPTSRTCSSTTSSTRLSIKRSPAGESELPGHIITQFSANQSTALSPRVLFGVSPLPLSALLYPSTTATGPRISPPTFSRHSVTTSVPTLSVSSPNTLARPTPRARTSTSTGLDEEAMCLLRRTTHKRRWKCRLYRQERPGLVCQLRQKAC